LIRFEDESFGFPGRLFGLDRALYGGMLFLDGGLRIPTLLDMTWIEVGTLYTESRKRASLRPCRINVIFFLFSGFSKPGSDSS
jgi:hypothetical protein